MWGRLVFTDYATGCLRKIYLRSRGVRESVEAIHGQRGAEFERKFGERLGADQSIKVEAEKPVLQPIDGHPGFSFSGRMDYLATCGDDLKVYELKSTQSKSVLRAMKSGQYKTENLAQLISYMTAVGTDKGELRYAYMEPSPAGYTIKQERGFEIEVDDFGRILVDNRPIKFTVYDQLAHQHGAARVIEEDLVWDRPVGYNQAFGSPCSYCPFKSACDRYDQGIIVGNTAYVEAAKQSLGEKSNGK